MMDMKVVLYSDPTPIFVLVAGFHFEKGQHVEAGRVIVEMLEECDCGMLPKPGFSTKPVRGLLLRLAGEAWGDQARERPS